MRGRLGQQHPPCLCSRQDISSRRTVSRRVMQRDSLLGAVLGRLPSRMEESPSTPTMPCSNPHYSSLRSSAQIGENGGSRVPTHPRGLRILCYCLLPGRFLCFPQLCSRSFDSPYTKLYMTSSARYGTQDRQQACSNRHHHLWVWQSLYR